MKGDAPRETLVVENHGGALWLVAMEIDGTSRKLAKFSSGKTVAQYQRLAQLRDMYMHALGQLGI